MRRPGDGRDSLPRAQRPPLPLHGLRGGTAETRYPTSQGERVSDAMTPEERRSHVEAAIQRTEEAQGEYVKRQLEEPFVSRRDARPFIALPRGTSHPLQLELRPYYVPEDGLYHTGLFDPQGEPDAMPFRSSARGYPLTQ